MAMHAIIALPEYDQWQVIGNLFIQRTGTRNRANEISSMQTKPQTHDRCELDYQPVRKSENTTGRIQLSSLSLATARAIVVLATELKERSSFLRLRLRSVSRVLSRTPHLASCFQMPHEHVCVEWCLDQGALPLSVP